MYLSIIISFSLGCTDSDTKSYIGPDDEQHMIKIIDSKHSQGEFWIDEFEFPNRPNEKPRAYTSFEQAKTACEEAGKRLCTASEWRRACLGPNNKRFGYADLYEQKNCKSAISLPSGHSSMMDPTAFLSLSGQRKSCRTEEGVFDMIGNLEEWVLDDWQNSPASLEGGAWYTYLEYADCTGRYSRQPDYRTPLNRRVFSAGFRCCWTADEISPEEISRDAKERLKEERNIADYEPKNEIQLAENTFIDQLEYPNSLGAKPLVNISWEEANQRCQDAGKRLCHAYEWETACAGKSHWRYPYGNDYIRSACAIQETEAATSGAFFGCISPAGAQDMVGSVWEWTASPLDAEALKGNATSTPYEIRGGSWFVDPEKGVCRPDDGYPLVPAANHFPDLGFRCCRGEALPTTVPAPSITHSCPQNMKAVGNFCIDQYEYPNIKDKEPLYDPNFEEAKLHCQKEGKHLCTNQEWTLACEGKEKRRWPYGNLYDPRMCHDQGYTSQEGGMVQPSGSFSECKTPEDVYDINGNLWEWTMDADNSNIGYLKGGGWNISAGLGQCRVSAPAQTNFHSGELGFRCCANQSELSILMQPQ